MSGEACFLDTNILVYLVGSDLAKAARSSQLIDAGGVVSVQVLNEFVAVSVRKYRIEWSRIEFILSTVKAACSVVPPLRCKPTSAESRCGNAMASQFMTR